MDSLASGRVGGWGQPVTTTTPVNKQYKGVSAYLFYLLRAFREKGLECVHGNHPGRYGGPNILSQKWPQGDVLPFLRNREEIKM